MKRKMSLFCIVLSMSIIANQVVFANEVIRKELNDETQIKLLLNHYFNEKYESLAHLNEINSKSLVQKILNSMQQLQQRKNIN